MERSSQSDPRRTWLPLLGVLLASVIATAAIAIGLETPARAPRAAWLALPPLAFAFLGFRRLHPHPIVRVPAAFAAWAFAVFVATKLYYVVGGGAAACAIGGFWAGAGLLTLSLVANRSAAAQSRPLLLAAGLIWVLGSTAIGHGIDLNLDRPLAKPRPGRVFVALGVLAWHLPFAGIRRASRPAAS